MDPTPLFTKTFDFVTWLMPITNTFPRTQRFVVTQRLMDATLNFYELTLEANNLRMPARLDKLELADAELDKMRVYWRLALKWNWLNPGRYHHGAVMLTEMGWLLGGPRLVRRCPAEAKNDGAVRVLAESSLSPHPSPSRGGAGGGVGRANIRQPVPCRLHPRLGRATRQIDTPRGACYTHADQPPHSLSAPGTVPEGSAARV